ncbi:hypothetical protein T10_2774 [Trichinella papuae]|uniref:Secreted protein n=1 Tax=Trichinella papuae TaxID=268474 RepID=A0A0V1N800_9BILA|nr:hypothetical protein T10_2774 [Trichinella papuae]
MISFASLTFVNSLLCNLICADKIENCKCNLQKKRNRLVLVVDKKGIITFTIELISKGKYSCYPLFKQSFQSEYCSGKQNCYTKFDE